MRTPIEEVQYDKKSIERINIYEKLNRKIHYVLSIDPAEGLGLNNNAFTLINPHTEMIAAEYKSPYISPPDFFRLICNFMNDRCPKSMIVIESNRGRELINRFLESKYRYQLWYDNKKLTSKKVVTTDEYGAERRAANERRAFGFDTTSSSKPLLFSILENFMEEQLDKITTQYIVKDINSVQRMPNGKIVLGADSADDDDEGVSHGDNLMSWLIGLFVLFNAENLEEYGIRKGASEPDNPDRELSPQEKKQQILSLMDSLSPELQELFQDVLKESDPVQDSLKHEMEVQKELSMRDQSFGVEEDYDMRFYNEDVERMDQQRFEQTIFESNFGGGSFGSHSQFNVDDWV